MTIGVKFIYHPENDIMGKNGKTIPGESILYELSKPFNADKPNSKFWLTCFKCGITANLGDHDIVFGGDNVTISPSILCPRKGCGNHYYIKNNEVIQT